MKRTDEARKGIARRADRSRSFTPTEIRFLIAANKVADAMVEKIVQAGLATGLL